MSYWNLSVENTDVQEKYHFNLYFSRSCLHKNKERTRKQVFIGKDGFHEPAFHGSGKEHQTRVDGSPRHSVVSPPLPPAFPRGNNTPVLVHFYFPSHPIHNNWERREGLGYWENLGCPGNYRRKSFETREQTGNLGLQLVYNHLISTPYFISEDILITQDPHT